MEILVLEEVDAEIHRSDSLKRELDNLVNYVRGAVTYADICIARSRTGVVKDTTIWKWKRGNISERALFFISHSPEQRVPYVIVHHVCNHADYERYISDAAALERETSERRRRTDVTEFVARLDHIQHPVPRIPDHYIGLREGFSVPRPALDGLLVTQSAEWVETTLIPLIETSASDDDCRARLEQLIGVLFDVDTTLDGLLTDDTKVEVQSDGLWVSLPDEPQPVTWRRRYSINEDDIDVERQMAILKASIASVDPFLILDRDQNKVLERFETSHKPLPALFDGPGGSGKTALLQTIAKGVLGDINRYSPPTCMRVVTLSDALTRNMQTALANYLHLVDGADRHLAQEISREVCRTFDDYLREFLDDETRRRLSRDDKRVRWANFHEWFNGLRAPFRPNVGVHEAWCALRVLILGDTDDRRDPDIRHGRGKLIEYLTDWFDQLPESRQHRIDRDVFTVTLELLGAYREWKRIDGLWDEADLVREALDALEVEGRGKRVDLVIVDEAQDLTPDMIRFITRSSAAFGYDLRADDTSVVSLPLIFAADDLQTVNPSGFSWKSFETIFYSETSRLMGGGPIEPVEYALESNFRMRAEVCSTATALRNWIDPSRTSHSLPLREGGFSGPSGKFGHTAKNTNRLFNVAARIIVPPGFDIVHGMTSAEKFLREMYSVTSANLDTRQTRALIDRLITANESKGQEFATAVLLGFGAFIRSMGPGLGDLYARQVTYVAASRARDSAVWFEVDEADEEWFWKGTDRRSPAQFFEKVKVLNKFILDEMKQSDSAVVAEANRLLRSVFADKDSDRPRLVASCRTASTRYFQIEDFAMAEFADAIGDFLEGKTPHVLLNDVPNMFLDRVVELMIDNRAWSAFDAVSHQGASKLMCAGALVMRFRRTERDLGEVVSWIKALLRSGVATKADLPAKVLAELADMASVAVADMEQRMLSGDHRLARNLDEQDLVFIESFGATDGVYLRCLVTLLGDDRPAALRLLFNLPPALRDKKEKLLSGLLRGYTGFTWVPDSLIGNLGLDGAKSDREVMMRWEAICDSIAANPSVASETFRRSLEEPDSIAEKALLRVAAVRINDLVLELQDSWS